MHVAQIFSATLRGLYLAIYLPVIILFWFSTVSECATLAELSSQHKQRASIIESYGRLPIVFEENQGQFEDSVKFVSRAQDHVSFLTNQGITFSFLSHTDLGIKPCETNLSRGPKSQFDVVRMRFPGGNPSPIIVGEKITAQISNYFLGTMSDSHTNIRNYEKVKYHNIYPHTDLVVYGRQDLLEFDLRVEPGGRPERIQFAFEGAQEIEISKSGDLVVITPSGQLKYLKPYVYQETSGKSKAINAHYILSKDKQSVGVQIAEKYDHASTLVVDPILVYSSYLGGTTGGGETWGSVAVDQQGHAYVTGITNSTDFPTTPGSYQTSTLNGGAFVTKFNLTGSSLVYSTYLGGLSGGFSFGYGIAVDQSGKTYITGVSTNGFPTTPNAFQQNCTGIGGPCAFVSVLDASGSSLVYSTFLGGGNNGFEIAVDNEGKIIITGVIGQGANSPQLPVVNAFQPLPGGTSDFFVSKLDITQQDPSKQIEFSTYVGGSQQEGDCNQLLGSGIAVDINRNIYVTGGTRSPDFPVTSAAYDRTCGTDGLCDPVSVFPKADAFVTKISPHGALIYSTYLGGANHDSAQAIAVNDAGQVYVGGLTFSSNFPLVNAFQPTFVDGSSSQAFVTKLNSNGSALINSTYLGGTGDNQAYGIALDGSGNVIVVGVTSAIDFPLSSPIQDTPGGAPTDLFITKFNPAMNGLIYSTYFGGSNAELSRIAFDGACIGNPLGVDGDGSVYVGGGTTFSLDYPTTASAFQPVPPTTQGSNDFITKIADGQSNIFNLEDIVPKVGGDTGQVSVSILGSGFIQGVSSKLTRAGEIDIIAEGNSVENSGFELEARFDLRGKARGKWNLVVTNPDNTSQTLFNAFEIEEGRDPVLWVDIIGRAASRPGQRQGYVIVVGNRGNVDAYGVPLWIAGIPNDSNLELGFELEPPPQIDGSPDINWQEVPNFIETSNDIQVPILLPVVAPGISAFLHFTFQVSSPVQLSAWVSRPFFLQDAVVSTRVFAELPLDPLVGACADAIFDLWFSTISLKSNFKCREDARTYSDFLHKKMVEEPPKTKFSFLQYWVSRFIKETKCLKLAIDLTGLPTAFHDKIENGCKPLMEKYYRKDLQVQIVTSRDPNDKVGSSGITSAQYITGEDPLRYVIYFENVDTATAPAQKVIIMDHLDTDKVTLSTLNLLGFGFGNNKVVLPHGNTLSTEVDLRPATNLIVRVRAHVDASNGVLSWVFDSIDPDTGLPPEDPFAGFLPPNVNPPNGEGYVVFAINPKQSLVSGTEITNAASIIFDTNDPIDTPGWLNTIDNSKPSSSISVLKSSQDSTCFDVQWAGTDSESGILDYSVYVSENHGTYYPWLQHVSFTSAAFNGQPGSSYSFYSVSRDRTGNIEDSPEVPDSDTQINAIPSIGFSLSCMPSPLFVPKDLFRPTTCTVASICGSNIEVGLSCEDLNDDSLCMFDPASVLVSANGQAVTELSVGVSSDLAAGTYSVPVNATSGNLSQTFNLEISVSYFFDDFEDGDAIDWTFKKGTWSVIDGDLTGSSTKKADIFSPFTQGCSQCAIEADIKLTTPGMSASLLGWYEDKKNLVELQFKEGKLKLKQKSSLGKGAKGNVKSAPVAINTNHHVKILYNGSDIKVYLDGNLVITAATSIPLSGNVGFRVKAGIAIFDNVVVY